MGRLREDAAALLTGLRDADVESLEEEPAMAHGEVGVLREDVLGDELLGA